MITLVTAELEKLRADAERYRYLREHWIALDVSTPGEPHRLLVGSDDLDAQVDCYREGRLPVKRTSSPWDSLTDEPCGAEHENPALARASA